MTTNIQKIILTIMHQSILLKIFTLIGDANVDGFPPPTTDDGVFPSDFLLGSLKMISQRHGNKAAVTFEKSLEYPRLTKAHQSYLKWRTRWSRGCDRFGRFGLDSFDDIFTLNDVLLGRKSFNTTDEKFLKTFGHDDNVLPRLVVDVTIRKHLVKVCYTLVRTPIIIVLQPLLDGPHVHRLLDNLKVVRESELDGVHRSMEGPGVGVFPHCLDDVALDDGDLVSVSASAASRRVEGRLVGSIDRRHLHLRPHRRLSTVLAVSGGRNVGQRVTGGRLAVHGW